VAINGAKTATTTRIRAITAPKAPRGFLLAKRLMCFQMAPPGIKPRIGTPEDTAMLPLCSAIPWLLCYGLTG
jgi:hypothetical protein